MLCSECSLYPCKQIDRIDNRYSKNYNMSMKRNLDEIRIKGIDAFIVEQHAKYRCPGCGGLISVHNGKCFTCDTVTRLIEKQNRE
ncbi:MAG: hypothetical protein JW822_14115 [Spirochaetales bacterium]|nr:hypothetical protein [Spirochaetales bacterium]